MAGRPVTDFVMFWVKASRVTREAIDDAVAVTGRGARRRGGKLPPHVVAAGLTVGTRRGGHSTLVAAATLGQPGSTQTSCQTR